MTTIRDFSTKDYTENKKIVVYGTGDMAAVVSWCLKEKHIPIYSFANKYGSLIPEIPIIDQMQLVNYDKRYELIILLAVTRAFDEVARELSDLGIITVYTVTNLLLESGFCNSNQSRRLTNAYANYLDVQANRDEKIYEDRGLVSVIMPVYNTERFLPSSITQIEKSTYSNIEIILVNDGSTDNSLEICSEFAEKDKRIKVLNTSHLGVVNARNTGIHAAQGKWISFVDSDDLISPDHLMNCVKNIGNCDSLMCGHNVWNGSEEYSVYQGVQDGLYNEEMLKELWKKMFEHGKEYITSKLWDKFFRAEICKESCDLVDPRIFVKEDRVLVHLFLLNCRSVNVVSETGYTQIFRTNTEEDRRYQFARLFENYGYYYNCQFDYLDSHSEFKWLISALNLEMRYIYQSLFDRFYQVDRLSDFK